MAEMRRQCRAVVSDKIGRLAELTDQIKETGVNILAIDTCEPCTGDYYGPQRKSQTLRKLKTLSREVI